MVKVLPVPVAPSSTWSRVALADAFYQLRDRFGLVAHGLIGRLEIEFHCIILP